MIRKTAAAIILMLICALPGIARTGNNPWQRLVNRRYNAAYWEPYVKLGQLRGFEKEKLDNILNNRIDYIIRIEEDVPGFNSEEIPYYLKIADLNINVDPLIQALNKSHDETGARQLADFLTICSGVLGFDDDELNSLLVPYSKYYTPEDLSTLKSLILKLRMSVRTWNPDVVKKQFLDLFRQGYSVSYINRKLVR